MQCFVCVLIVKLGESESQKTNWYTFIIITIIW